MHQMSFGGRAPPGPAGGAYSVPPDPLAALKLLAPSELDPRRLWRLASHLQRSETEGSGSSFPPFEHWGPTLTWSTASNLEQVANLLCAPANSAS